MYERQKGLGNRPTKSWKRMDGSKDWGCWRIKGCVSRGRKGNHKNRVYFRTKTRASLDRAPQYLKTNFAFRHSNVPRISPRVAKHQLKVNQPSPLSVRKRGILEAKGRRQ